MGSVLIVGRHRHAGRIPHAQAADRRNAGARDVAAACPGRSVVHLALIRAARATGASRFVYLSVYDHGPAYHQIPFFRLKLEVEAQLKASGLPFTIVRPTAFMDFHAHALIGTPILEKRRVVLVGRGERPRNFVAADDVARLVVVALGEPSLAGETVDIGGPGTSRPWTSCADTSALPAKSHTLTF